MNQHVARWLAVPGPRRRGLAVLARLQARLDALGALRLRDEDGYEYGDLRPDWEPGDVIGL